MNENTCEAKGLFETLEEKSLNQKEENEITFMPDFGTNYEEEHKYEFLIQDMFMDHFFP